MKLYYPVKPFKVIQGFGANPDYYARFRDIFGKPELGHMGIDVEAYHGQPVYASCDGTALYIKDSHGGEGVHITTSDFYDVIHWHLIGDTDPLFPPPIPMNNIKTQVKVGDLIGYADNTGAPFESSGDHLHLGLLPQDQYANSKFSANGFNGCVDPTPFFNGQYAVDKGLVKDNDLSYNIPEADPAMELAKFALKNPSFLKQFGMTILNILKSFLKH